MGAHVQYETSLLLGLPFYNIHNKSCSHISVKWIRTADSAKRAQQTQFMLIIDNMHLPIPRKARLYDDVMHTWTQALTVAEN